MYSWVRATKYSTDTGRIPLSMPQTPSPKLQPLNPDPSQDEAPDGGTRDDLELVNIYDTCPGMYKYSTVQCSIDGGHPSPNRLCRPHCACHQRKGGAPEAILSSYSQSQYLQCVNGKAQIFPTDVLKVCICEGQKRESKTTT